MTTTQSNQSTPFAQDQAPLLGRRALVTGASSGIGRATALALAGAGARVALLARRAERLEAVAEEIRAAGGEAIPVVADVTDYAALAEAVTRVEDTFGGVDILINNAGIMLPAPIVSADPVDWARMIDVNLTGALHAVRAVLPGMTVRGEGHIVNVSSNSGRVHQPQFSVYAATKHALGAFTTILRKEVYPSSIRVTLFEPGATESELAGHADQELISAVVAEMGDMELLRAEDVAAGILWTLSVPERVNVGDVLYMPINQRDW
jgi:NADP-dependent 3-hydroxy acid dehydrogenase YdfG